MTDIQGPTSHTYFSQRLRLHYVNWGNDHGKRLLLVHGGMDHCRNWDWVAQELRSRYHIIAPDLRGHGDSQWMLGGSYGMPDFIYDIAQLVHQTKHTPTHIIAHSLGGAIALRYAGLYPENVEKLVVIEGLGLSPKMEAEIAAKSSDDRLRDWVETCRKISSRTPRRYKTLDEAHLRMQEENPHLRPDQARHLTIHGANQNEDGTYSWKFDNYVRAWPPFGMPDEAVHKLWSNITCPTLLIRGTESWASDPNEDGRANHFQNATVASVDNAGHWVHHDQLDVFMGLINDFFEG